VVLFALAHVSVVRCVVAEQTLPFDVEPLMNRLHFFGPLLGGDGGWYPLPMTLIAGTHTHTHTHTQSISPDKQAAHAQFVRTMCGSSAHCLSLVLALTCADVAFPDYTWQVNVTLEVNTFFLLVNVAPDGTPDWKTCKLGRGLDAARLVIGGGNIPVPARGDYTLTFFTPSFSNARPPLPDPNGFPSCFRMEGHALWPAVTISSSSFVMQTSPVIIDLHFMVPMDVSSMRANFTRIHIINAVANVTSIELVSDTHIQLRVTPDTALQNNIVRIDFPEGMLSALDDPRTREAGVTPGFSNTGASWRFIYSPPSRRSGSARWTPLTMLRDAGNRWVVGRPAGGWWVTAIHANMIPSTGQLLLTGWGRSQEFACTSAGARKFGVSFLLHPSELDAQPMLNASLNVRTLGEAPRQPGDVLYCSGHTTLKDGRKLFSGQTRRGTARQPHQSQTIFHSSSYLSILVCSSHVLFLCRWRGVSQSELRY
jgi:hypothetical protein